MKRYNVTNLFVVEVHTIEGPEYFICKYNVLNDTYNEFFTNERIYVKKNQNVMPLSTYYPEGSVIKGQLMVDKREILGKYLEINDKSKQQEYNSLEVVNSLNEATTNFFAGDGSWSSACFTRLNELSMVYLPCNLNDDLWLARMLLKNQKLNLELYQVLEYVKTSAYFAEKKHEYAQRIVAWQIDWILNGGENWITDEQYGNDFIMYSPDCDKGIRAGVLKTLKVIGIDESEIEEGIEKNAAKWRDKAMKLAFNNIYSPIFYDFNPDYNDEKNEKYSEELEEPLPEVDPLLEKNWLTMRKYEYFQEHKESVERYGSVEPEMKMTKNEADNVNATLTKLHNERMYQILEYRRNRKANRQKR